MSKRLVTRRGALQAGLAAAGGLLLPGCSDRAPPTYGNLLRMGDDLTYFAQRLLLPGQKMVPEYAQGDISSFPAVGVIDPGSSTKHAWGETYRRSKAAGFADWRLSVEGLVARPASYSIDELKRLPRRTQITRHVCEEGWSAIAEWTGVPLRWVLEAAGMAPTARYVTLSSLDDYVDSIDMLDALHPQTLLAFGMNGRDLLVRHGAPLRLRVETQCGYKSMKYLQRIVVSDKLDDGGAYGNVQNGWSWYAGI